MSLNCVSLCDPMDYTVHGIFQARILEWVAFHLSRGSSQPRSPALQADSLPAEPPGKPKNTGVGSLSLLQGIFPTRNWTRASRITDGFFTNWAIREAQAFNKPVVFNCICKKNWFCNFKRNFVSAHFLQSLKNIVATFFFLFVIMVS